MIKLGIDIGATGIKGALINTQTGELVSERIRILTPKDAEPEKLVNIVQQIVDELQWDGDIGIGFPGLIRKNRCISTGNLSSQWNGLNLPKYFSKLLKQKVTVANDADVAGLAEARFSLENEGKLNEFVLFLTLGTGVGSAFIINGTLLPNTEFGHMPYKEGKLEDYVSNSARKEHEMSWEEFGKKLNKALHQLHALLSPDRIIIGGGISKKFSKYGPYIDKEMNVKPSTLQNAAGTIGAALLCN